MNKLEDTSTQLSVNLAIAGYSLCSSTLLLANKVAMEYLPVPTVVILIQLVFSTAILFALKYFGVLSIDDFEIAKVKAYFMYIIAFVAATYTNMKALSVSNVETVIVFRACTPLAVGFVEYCFMEREFPSLRSCCCLVAVVFGAAVYCCYDSQFAMKGFSAYSWVLAYFLLITFEMTYGKLLTSSVKMESVWGPVLYCNALSIVPMFLLGHFNGEFENLWSKLLAVPTGGAMIIFFSCVVGTLIGYTGWLCRGMVSATTYTLVGVVNKFITVWLNVTLWDKHSSVVGLLSVLVCLCAGSLYQQSPRRDDSRKSNSNDNFSAMLTSSSTDGFSTVVELKRLLGHLNIATSFHQSKSKEELIAMLDDDSA